MALKKSALPIVLGYHGCTRETARDVILNRARLKPSENDYDWLGPGIYFWENDPQRAMEWARHQRHSKDDPAVVGAIIDLGDCLNLVVRSDIEILKAAYVELAKLFETAGLPLPSNTPIPGKIDPFNKLRRLDCAVVKMVHQLAEDPDFPDYDPLDSVRAMFPEGDEIYPGSGFREQNHIQIAIRSQHCVRGYFLPPELGQKLS